MDDPQTRRDVVGRIFAAGAMASTSASGLGNGGSSGDEPAARDAVSIGLFANARKLRLSHECTIVRSTGHSIAGNGAAFYVRDSKVNAAHAVSHPRTSFVDARGQGFRLTEPLIDVRQVGAIGDGITDDTAACQEALDIVEATGGGVLILPPGEYRITSPLKLPPRVGLRGQGQSSLLRAQGCDAIAIAGSDSIGPRRISDFAIQGHGGEHACAIKCDLDEDSRAQGLVFENLYISFFGTGVSSRGLWHTSFRTVSLHQVWHGVLLYGRNVKITIDDCRITHGGLLRGEGSSTGLQVGDGASRFRPEDVQVDKSIIYGFNKAIVWRTALFGGVRSCDLDACTTIGLELVTADGGFTFRDNWVQVDGDAVRGIDCTALGYQPQMTNILIANNRINANTASGQSWGIMLGNQQGDVVVDGNSISGRFSGGIWAQGVNRLNLLNNKIEGTMVVERCKGVTITHNHVAGGMTLNANAGLANGMTFGPQSGRIVGAITLAPGKVTQTATFRSLGLPDLPEGKYGISLALYIGSAHSRGDIRGHVTRTDIVVEVDHPLAEQAEVSFQIDIR